MQFDFGQNWKEFSESRLSQEKVKQAREHFHALMEDVELKGKRFLDIGFGQGLSLMLAHQAGAQVTGMDINPKCAEVVQKNQALLGIEGHLEAVVGSILDTSLVEKLKKNPYDIVHSWGVLHHTGDMYRAIDNACSLVAPQGNLVIAIYNRHWSSSLWKAIKWFYCSSPKLIQKLLVYLFFPIIFVAKFLVTGENPLRMSRGMDFFYNVVDWVGGYPYEYASTDEMVNCLAAKGFALVRKVPAKVPTGCNEFVFARIDAALESQGCIRP